MFTPHEPLLTTCKYQKSCLFLNYLFNPTVNYMRASSLVWKYVKRKRNPTYIYLPHKYGLKFVWTELLVKKEKKSRDNKRAMSWTQANHGQGKKLGVHVRAIFFLWPETEQVVQVEMWVDLMKGQCSIGMIKHPGSLLRAVQS